MILSSFVKVSKGLENLNKNLSNNTLRQSANSFKEIEQAAELAILCDNWDSSFWSIIDSSKNVYKPFTFLIIEFGLPKE